MTEPIIDNILSLFTKASNIIETLGDNQRILARQIEQQRRELVELNKSIDDIRARQGTSDE